MVGLWVWPMTDSTARWCSSVYGLLSGAKLKACSAASGSGSAGASTAAGANGAASTLAGSVLSQLLRSNGSFDIGRVNPFAVQYTASRASGTVRTTQA